MGIASELLNAQRRPDKEAARITSEIASALENEGGEFTPDTSARAFAASDRAAQEIADERAPKRAPITYEQISEFVDEETVTEAPDSEPIEAAFVTPPAQYLLDEDTQGMEPKTPSTANQDTVEPAPWLTDAELKDRGISVVEATTSPLAPPVLPSSAISQAFIDPRDSRTTLPDATTADAEGAPAFFARSAEEIAEIEQDAPLSEPEDSGDVSPGNESDPEPDGDDADQLVTPTQEPAPAPATVHHPVVQPSWGARDPYSGGDFGAPTTAPTAPIPESAVPESAPVDPDTQTTPEGEAPMRAGPSVSATPPPAAITAPDPEQPLSGKERLTRIRDAALAYHRSPADGTLLKTKVATTAGIAMVMLLVVIVGASSIFTGGNGESGATAQTGQAQSAPPPAENTAANTADDEITLIPDDPNGGVSTSCGNEFDAVAPFSNDKTRAWVCNRANGIDGGAVLNISFAKDVVITSITVVPGFNYIAPDGRDEWPRHRVVTSVSWRMGGKIYPQKLTPTRTGVMQKFDSIQAQRLSMTITGSMRPPVGDGQSRMTLGGKTQSITPEEVDETTAIASIVIKGRHANPTQPRN